MAEIKVYRDRNFQIVCGSTLLSMMMVVVIVPAFPKIVAALGITEQSVGLLITAYTIPSFLLAPFGGIMADRFGRKRVLVPAIFLFGIAGGTCGLANDFNTLLILRVVQGIGGAPLTAISFAIIGDIFDGQNRAEAMGLNITANYVGYIIYPLVGGALASLAWNYTFLSFLLAIPLGILTLFYLHCPEPKSQRTLKGYVGDALHYLWSLKVLWLFSATSIAYILLYGAYLTYFSLLLGNRFQASPFIIGLFVAIVGLITATISSQSGYLVKRFSPVSIIIAAFAIYAVAMLITPVMPNIYILVLPTVIFGIAHGINIPSQNVIAASVTPLENRAGFMAIQGAMRTLGMTIGPPIMSLAYTFTSLDITFILAAMIALIIPIMAIIIGRNKLSVT
jgi:ACDE family multidrug resistance protein